MSGPAGAVVHSYKDTTFAFRQTITDPFGVAANNFNAFNNSANWEVNTTCNATDGFNDQLNIGWFAKHMVPPHGEGPNALGYIDGFDVDADKYPTGSFKLQTQHTMGHGSHFNHFVARLLFDVTSNFGSDQITSYNFVFVGGHTDSWYQQIYLETTLVSTNVVPPTNSLAKGNCITNYNNTTGQIGVSVGINGISKNQVLGATLHLAPPGQNGQAIANLGGSGVWDDMGQNSASLMFDFGQLQPFFYPFLKKGLVYIVVSTVAHPQGEIRGQLRLVTTSSLPQP